MKAQIRYIDGRDTQATPPLTLRRVNVWELPGQKHRGMEAIGVLHNSVRFTLRHGKRVRVLYVAMGWSYVQRWGRRGWIKNAFLSKQPEAPAGDWI